MVKTHWCAFVLIVAFSLTACGQGFQMPIESRLLSVERNGLHKLVRLRDHFIASQVPQVPLDQAFTYFNSHRDLIKNQTWLTIIDFTRHSREKRMFVMNLENGQLDQLAVAHGEGSDPEDIGWARIFSDFEGSGASSLGFYLVNEPYVGRWGKSARLDGLSSTNRNARDRAIVLHGATYVSDGLEKQGLTLGCPAIDERLIDLMVNRLSGKSLMYAYLEGLKVD